MLVALAPILTDAPLVIAAGLLVSAVAGMNAILGVLSVLGALVVGYLAWDAYNAQIPSVENAGEPRSIMKSIAVNLVNPHPYVFWFMVGGPLVTSALERRYASRLFSRGFFRLFSRGKACARSGDRTLQKWLLGPPYRMVMRGLALALLVFAVFMFTDGVEKLWDRALFSFLAESSSRARSIMCSQDGRCCKEQAAR